MTMKTKSLAAGLMASILMGSVTAAAAPNPGGPQSNAKDAVGAVYTMTNDPAGNQIVMYDRDASGFLTNTGSIDTGGTGSGGGLDPLASQGSLVLSSNGRWLLAVNAGSNDISVFRVWPSTLELVDTVPSGGEFPVSLTVSGNLVYVLNAGGDPNITGFSLSYAGKLNPLDDSIRSLGAGAFAQVGFDPQGQLLVVTDKAAHAIFVFALDRDGLPATSPVVSASNGNVPFGFIFDRHAHLYVVEAATNAVSSYDILDDTTLQTISASVPNGQVAACWIAGDDRHFIYTTNPGTQSVSSYRMEQDGSLSLLQGVAGEGNRPLDLALAENGRFLYAVDPSDGGIDMFRVAHNGSLTNLGTAPGGLSVFAQGLAVR
jgi:6-phosphogluconolactonase